MKAGQVALAAALSALTLAGCVSHGGPGGCCPPGTAQSAAGQALAPQAAMARLQLGASTKQDVASALGPARVARFDSGHEVWVYRWPGRDGTPEQASELVLLFPPTGPLAKFRLKPGA